MRIPQKVKISLIKKEVFLFKPGVKKSFDGFLPLLDSCLNLLCGFEALNENEPEGYFFILPESDHSVRAILKFYEGWSGKKLSFFEKIYFYRGIQKLYPELNKQNLIESLGFSPQKIKVIDYFASQKQETADHLSEQGISSLREAEYFYELEAHGFGALLLNAKLPKTQFKLALNASFELYKSGRLKDFEQLKPEEVENFINRNRYPAFFDFLGRYQKQISQMIHPKTAKIYTHPFFEGGKLLMNLEFKNVQQFEETLLFFQKEKERIKELIQFIAE